VELELPLVARASEREQEVLLAIFKGASGKMAL
jgi:hypothetical protein